MKATHRSGAQTIAAARPSLVKRRRPSATRTRRYTASHNAITGEKNTNATTATTTATKSASNAPIGRANTACVDARHGKLASPGSTSATTVAAASHKAANLAQFPIAQRDAFRTASPSAVQRADGRGGCGHAGDVVSVACASVSK